MKFTTGSYKKLGPNVLVVNRPVGTSCPMSCAYHPENVGPLGNKCYMVRTEGMRPNVRKAAMKNMEGRAEELADALFDHAGKLTRMHVGGDFLGEAGEFDMNYILHWRMALQSLEIMPRILCFTHVYDRRLVKEFLPFAPEFQLIASIHDERDMDRAVGAGFTRFALAMEETHYEWEWDRAWINRLGLKFLVCPEQRKKLPNCESCRYCWREWPHGGHVAFMEHSQPNWKEVHARKASEAESARTGA